MIKSASVDLFYTDTHIQNAVQGTSDSIFGLNHKGIAGTVLKSAMP